MRHVIRYDSDGRASCTDCGWSSIGTGDAAITAAIRHTQATRKPIRPLRRIV